MYSSDKRFDLKSGAFRVAVQVFMVAFVLYALQLVIWMMYSIWVLQREVVVQAVSNMQSYTIKVTASAVNGFGQLVARGSQVTLSG